MWILKTLLWRRTRMQNNHTHSVTWPSMQSGAEVPAVRAEAWQQAVILLLPKVNSLSTPVGLHPLWEQACVLPASRSLCRHWHLTGGPTAECGSEHSGCRSRKFTLNVDISNFLKKQLLFRLSITLLYFTSRVCYKAKKNSHTWRVQ